jgi:hypothetical protein
MIGNMNRTLLLSTSLACWTWLAQAAVPPVEQLLPADTLGLITIPDWDKAMAASEKTPFGQLWQDSALKPLREKLVKQWKDDVVGPIEKQLGIQLADFSGLVHGQVTLAVTRNGWDGRSEKTPGLILLIDSKDQSERLKNLLTALKKKWVDSGRQIKSEKIREVEFTTLLMGRDDLNHVLEKALLAPPSDPAGKSDAPKAGDKLEISFGQSESLLIIGNAAKDIEKVLIRQSGGSIAALAELPAYEASHAAMFRDAAAYGWIHFKAVFDDLSRQLTEATGANSPDLPPGLRPEKILAMTGLGGLKTIAFKASTADDGSLVELFLGVPESSRQGLFKLLAVEAKETAPPPFVPADALKYSRWRLDSQKAWAALEGMLLAISPELGGLLQIIGKDKDPNFDLKKDLIGNLGNDFMEYEKSPRSSTLEDLNSPPSLYLIGSPSAEKLAQAFKASTSILPTPTGSEAALKEREFLGRKVYSMALPSMPGLDGSKPVKQSLNFAASGGYLAISTDVALLEEFLRSNESTGKALRETPGLSEAAQKVGGMNTGFFGYENQSESMRGTLETLKNDAIRLRKLFTIGEKPGSNVDQNLKEWLDFALLPPFDQLAKYFHFVVYSGSATSSGLSWKLFAPTPPQLRK